MRRVWRTCIVISLSFGMLASISAVSAVSHRAHSAQMAQQTTILSFFEECCDAKWWSGVVLLAKQEEAQSIPCPGSETDERGFVRPLSANFTLESDQPANRSIQTHPMWQPNGYIFGVFELGSFGVQLQSGDRFKAQVGFLKGAQAGQVRFSVIYDERPDQSGGETLIKEVTDSHDGKLRTLDVSLSQFANGRGAIILRVDALESSAQDWAVWVNPRIERELRPTATPTPKPTRTITPTIHPTVTPVITEPPILPDEDLIDLLDGFSFISEGPVMQDALGDGDGDGVMNYLDECPNTPSDRYDQIFENGCLCQETDRGLEYTRAGSITFYLEHGEGSGRDFCTNEILREYACNPDYETGGAEPALVREIDCTTLGSNYHCRTDRCIPVVEAIPQYCWSGEATCADGIQNQSEEGVDCGGKCPPCNTHCTSRTRYAPPDTPCTSFYPTDPHRIDLPWTDNELEYTCQFHEVCHPDLDHVIEEATRCCSIPTTRSGMTSEESSRLLEEEINRMPDPNLCQEARSLTGRSASCKRCVGLYIIKGLGRYARWMVGYNWLYPANNVYGSIDQLPAEQLINDFKTGVCRDYSEAVSTLLRKAGFSAQEVGGFCDGGHCYNVVKLPGDTEWHVVDTTGNMDGINLGGLPGGHPYCEKLNESNWCWNDFLSTGESCTGSELVEFEVSFSCSPGMACNRDLLRIPGWAPTIDNIVGCSP